MDGKQQYDSGLEPARQDFPEVSPDQQAYGYQLPQHQQHQHQQPHQQQYQNAAQPLPLQAQQPYYPQHLYDASTKPEVAAVAPSTYGSQTIGSSPFSAHSEPLGADGDAADRGVGGSKQPLASRTTVCGCSLLVLILSCIIALLSAAVIGLAAATGIEAQHASSAQASLAAVSASTTASAAAATATAVIDDGCSEDPASADKTVYTAFSLLGAFKFTRYCNKDAPHPPLLSLFTADFDTCMDACAAYTKYVPNSFSGSGNGTGSSVSNNATCAAVSFIPAWTNKTTASNGGAPGNCYLKAGPQNETGLTVPNIGTDCHAAVLAVGGSSSSSS